MRSSKFLEFTYLFLSAGAAALVVFKSLTTDTFTEDDWIVSGISAISLGMYFLRRWRRRVLEKTMDS